MGSYGLESVLVLVVCDEHRLPIHRRLRYFRVEYIYSNLTTTIHSLLLLFLGNGGLFLLMVAVGSLLMLIVASDCSLFALL